MKLVKIARYTTNMVARAEVEINDWVEKNEVEVESIQCVQGNAFHEITSIRPTEIELLFIILYRKKEDK